jgi:sugar lactone lactonase YvrE
VAVQGIVYVADSGNHRIRKIASDGTVSTLAGTGIAGFADGPGTTAQFADPGGVAVDAAGFVYVADQGNNRVRKVAPDGTVSTSAGNGQMGYVDGPGATAQSSAPLAVTVDAAGDLYIAEWSNNRIRRISTAGQVTTLAGSGRLPNELYVDGPGSAAGFQQLAGIASDSAGNAFVSEFGGQRIRRIDSAGNVVTVAGSYPPGFSDGPGTTAKFLNPAGVAMSPSGALLVADQGNHCIRSVAPDGTVTTLAGSGSAGYLDGPVVAAQFSSPTGVAVDAAGNVLVADRDNHRIRKLAPDGTVSTVAGSGAPGFADGPAGAARFSAPSGVAVDPRGTIWVADSGNSRVRAITGGAVRSVAGSEGHFHGASGLAVDGAGNVWVAKPGAHRIRRVATDGTVATAGGSGIAGGNDGLGVSASFRHPVAVAFDASGTLYVADQGNSAVRIGRSALLTDAATIDAATGSLGQECRLGTTANGATGWRWQVTRRPSGSTAALLRADSRTPTFTPDEPGAYIFRLTASDGSAQSVSETRLDSGMAFPDMYSVPADITALDYPGYYQRLQPRTVYHNDPYCQLTQNVVSYPASYLDVARLPQVTGAPLPTEIKRAIGLKDYWFREPGYGIICGPPSPSAPTMRDALTASVQRVKALGADYVVVKQGLCVTDVDKPRVYEPCAIPEWDLEFIVAEARRNGLGVGLLVNYGMEGVSKPPSREWFSAFLDDYSDFWIAQAALAERLGIAWLQLDWGAWMDVNLDGFIDIFNTRMLQTVQDARPIYHGKILVSATDFPYGGELPEQVFAAADMIMVQIGPVVPPEKRDTFTMDDLRRGYAELLRETDRRLSRFNKPHFISLLIQSHPDALVTGWIEECCCMTGCPQLDVETDFAAQAMAYEALLEELAKVHASGGMRIAVVEASSSGYWWSDPVLPAATFGSGPLQLLYGDTGFPNFGQTIRNKPAESITYEWFKR